MHVLLVAFGFPPSRASGVYRAIAFTRHLVALGHRVTVLTADEEYFALATGTDPELGATLPDGLAVVRVPYADLRDPVINRWTKRRAIRPRTWREEAEVERDAIFPERYGAWRDRIVAAAMRLQRRDPVEFAIATGNPYVSFPVLTALEATWGVRFVMDDRDSFLYSVYTGEPQPDFERRLAWWRPAADRASEVWFVNPPIASEYRSAFPEVAGRIHVVENGFDRHYFDPAARPPRPAGPPVFGYIGTLNTGFPLDGLLTSWKRARGREVPADARLVFVGGLGYREQSPAQRELLRDAEEHGVELRGPTPKTRIGDAYAECDVLVFAREGGGLVTSGKIYEYVASGLPIAGVVPTEHDSRRVLEGYPRSHVTAPDGPSAWARSLASALADAREPGEDRWREAMAFGRRYDRDAIMSEALSRALAVRHSGGP